MSLQRAPDRYSQPAILFHWAIFLLVALAYLAIEVRGPKGTDSRTFWSNVHFWAAHEWIGNAFYWVIGLHALAASVHHAVFKDRTLRGMI